MESMQYAVTSKAITWDGHTHFLAIILVHANEKLPFYFNENQKDFFLYSLSHTIVIKRKVLKIRKVEKIKSNVAKDQSSNTDGDTLNNFNYDSYLVGEH